MVVQLDPQVSEHIAASPRLVIALEMPHRACRAAHPLIWHVRVATTKQVLARLFVTSALRANINHRRLVLHRAARVVLATIHR